MVLKSQFSSRKKIHKFDFYRQLTFGIICRLPGGNWHFRFTTEDRKLVKSTSTVMASNIVRSRILTTWVTNLLAITILKTIDPCQRLSNELHFLLIFRKCPCKFLRKLQLPREYDLRSFQNNITTFHLRWASAHSLLIAIKNCLIVYSLGEVKPWPRSRGRGGCVTFSTI